MTRRTVATLSKSESFRRALKSDPEMTISAAAKKFDMNYAFAYGVAQRAGLAQTHAKRRPESNSKLVDLVCAAQPKWTRERAAKFVKDYLTR